MLFYGSPSSYTASYLETLFAITPRKVTVLLSPIFTHEWIEIVITCPMIAILSPCLQLASLFYLADSSPLTSSHSLGRLVDNADILLLSDPWHTALHSPLYSKGVTVFVVVLRCHGMSITVWCHLTNTSEWVLKKSSPHFNAGCSKEPRNCQQLSLQKKKKNKQTDKEEKW